MARSHPKSSHAFKLKKQKSKERAGRRISLVIIKNLLKTSTIAQELSQKQINRVQTELSRNLYELCKDTLDNDEIDVKAFEAEWLKGARMHELFRGRFYVSRLTKTCFPETTGIKPKIRQ